MERNQPFAMRLSASSHEEPPVFRDQQKKPNLVEARQDSYRPAADIKTGISVKERMAAFQKPPSAEAPVTKSTVIEPTGVSVRERAKTTFAAPAPTHSQQAAPREEIPVRKSIQERQAEMQANMKPQVEAQSQPQIGSVKNRINAFQAAIQSQAVSKKAPEVSVNIAERKSILTQGATSVPQKPVPVVIESQTSVAQMRDNLLKGRTEEDQKLKEQPVRTGKIAEMASKLQSAPVQPSPSQTKPVDVGVSINEKKLLLQQAGKTEIEKVKDDLEGLPSVAMRKSLITAKNVTESHRESAPLPVGSIKERLSIFSGAAKPQRDDDSSGSEKEEVKEAVAEPVESLADRKAKIQQSLQAKYADARKPAFTMAMGPAQEFNSAPTAAAVQCVAEKPTIKRNVPRSTTDFDDFD